MRSARRGFTLIEVSVAAAVAIAVITLLAQALVWRLAANRMAERRTRALVVADNLLEQAAVLDWAQLDADHLRPLAEDPQWLASLPGATIELDSDIVAGPPAAKHLRVRIRGAEGSSARPLRLSRWVFEPALQPTGQE